MYDSELYSMAAALYAGGWRSDDLEDLAAEYDLTYEQSCVIAEIMEGFEDEAC